MRLLSFGGVSSQGACGFYDRRWLIEKLALCSVVSIKSYRSEQHLNQPASTKVGSPSEQFGRGRQKVEKSQDSAQLDLDLRVDFC